MKARTEIPKFEQEDIGVKDSERGKVPKRLGVEVHDCQIEREN